MFCVFASNGSKAQDSILYTLQKCIDIAFKNNLTLAVSNNQLQNSNLNLQQARGSLLPSIYGYANQGISNGKSINPYTNTFINQEINTGQYGVNASFTLFNGLNTFNSLQKSKSSYKANEMDFKQAKIDLSIQVTLGYLQVVSTSEILTQSLLQLAVTQNQIDRLDALNNNNAISPSVLYDTKGQLAYDKINLINAKASLVSAKLYLAQLLNIAFSTNDKFQSVESESKFEQLNVDASNFYSQTYASSPLIKSYEYKKHSALKSLQASRGLLFPTISVNGNIGSNYSSAATLQKLKAVYDVATDAYVNVGGISSTVYSSQYDYTNEKVSFDNQIRNNLNSYLGLSIQLPLFNGLKVKSQISSSKLNYELAKIQKENADIRYKSTITQVCNDLQNAFERYEVYKDQVDNYYKSFQIAKLKFEKGSLTTLEFMNAKNNFDKASVNLIIAKSDFILRNKILELYKTS